jgi:mannosyl-oligosaccharide alpha-1,2-mannosidase
VYKAAITALEGKLLQKSQPNNLWYFAELKGTRMEHKMDHLVGQRILLLLIKQAIPLQACFIAGMFALQSTHETEEERRSHYVELAEQIGHTCHESYNRTGSLLHIKGLLIKI